MRLANEFQRRGCILRRELAEGRQANTHITKEASESLVGRGWKAYLLAISIARLDLRGSLLYRHGGRVLGFADLN